jgi:hypothetical protein
MTHMTDAATEYSIIRKNGFDLKYLLNMTTGTINSAWSLDQSRRSLINTSSVPKRSFMHNCISASLFKPENIDYSTNTFKVSQDQFISWMENHGIGIATVRDSGLPIKPIGEHMDIIFIESVKDPERMIPFIYVNSFKSATIDGYECFHEFTNAAHDWNFVIVKNTTMTVTQRVTSLPPSLPHPTLQGVIDQNEIARIIKQFTDDLENGAYHIE